MVSVAIARTHLLLKLGRLQQISKQGLVVMVFDLTRHVFRDPSLAGIGFRVALARQARDGRAQNGLIVRQLL